MRRAVSVAIAATGTLLLVVLGAAVSWGEQSRRGANCGAVSSDRSAWVSCVLGEMSLREKVGQMFVADGFGERVGAMGPTTVDNNHTLYGPNVDNLQNLINRYRLGGIVYFDWSNGLGSPWQIANLSNGIQRVAVGQPTQAPMLISTDQEQGEVLRISSPATVFPGNMALGATRSTKLARRNAAITGRELRAMGVNVDNAPVVDVNTNPKNAADGIRSFGDRTGFVSRFAQAQVDGYQQQGGVAAVAKHWPGLGDTSTNPDSGVTLSNQSLAQLRRQSFPAFQAAIRSGVDQVMVTHIEFPKILPSDVPSSLSRKFVQGLLRGELDYRGVIITDALNAQALSKYTPAQIALRAVKAGNDQLLEVAGFPTPAAADLVPAFQAVLNAVKDGRISIGRIEQSDRRILGLKWDLGLADNPFVNTDDLHRVVGTAKHLDVARRTAQRSITLLKNHRHLLPLRPRSDTRVLVAGWGQTSTPLIANEIESHGLTAQSLWTGQNPTRRQIQHAKQMARRYDVCVVDTFNVWAPQSYGQQRLIRGLLSSGCPVIVVAIGTPYDLAYFPHASALLAAYDYQQVSINASVAALFGRVNPHGRLPVTIPLPSNPNRVAYPFGFGLRYPKHR